MTKSRFDIADRVARALAEGAPVVALESTVIAHGLPYPQNIETAFACEEAVKNAGAVPATIGILDGAIRIGLDARELEQFARPDPDALPLLEKVGLNNLASVLERRQAGATTVATSLKLAHLVGIRVFSTGGIGGVHRGVAESFDISADLTALGSVPVMCVCAGAKAILDLEKTVEYLETLGVPIIGYQTSEFPAFYSRSSGIATDAEVGSPSEAARIATLHWSLGSSTSVLVGVPVPEVDELAPFDVERAVTQAISLAEQQGIRGKAVTPFILAQVKDLTGGRSLAANRALLVNNAGIAAQIASYL
jgi:pseudouridine-5'-phosphate glycosidase